jgi:hypothetical protein
VQVFDAGAVAPDPLPFSAPFTEPIANQGGRESTVTKPGARQENEPSPNSHARKRAPITLWLARHDFEYPVDVGLVVVEVPRGAQQSAAHGGDDSGRLQSLGRAG